ncbi:hypothetical protein [Nonomuraea dietziae]|uniref:hypothetical protein n=1 Tax=Nonomuraea dietziae TaxID=65515 RepID=UPI0033F251CE
MLVAVACVGLWQFGLAGPSLSHGPVLSVSGAYLDDDRPPTMTIDVEIHNEGSRAETVEAVGRSAPGMHLEKVGFEPGFPTKLAPGKRLLVELRYAITDCALAAREALAVPVRVRRWMGAVTVDARDDSHESGAWQNHPISTTCDEQL